MKLIIFVIFLLTSNLVYAGCEDQPSNEVDWTNCNFVENLDLIGVGMANAKMSGVNLSLANLQENGKEKLRQIATTLMETTNQIPSDIDWIIQVEGHTDKRPIRTIQFPSNWELSTARANSVLKLLLEIGFPPNRLAAAGYGEFYPISDGETNEDLQQNRRIELKLTSR